ncbi:hypothetical protein HORIV_07430 [Vreelandella olivaria]|uniref:Gfo/Idh/MocA-like oxidoreductase N-terminal domain-containing protein n=1 Tax=Vreelandella olivaria TaxID=390919 RepID=A0ABN5WQV4_9GAMM|nr:hypothetical protein HORIV_07430 [Halomonas olivaria]
MRTIRFGIIGCGLMGREFASAAARWLHLADAPARPEIVAVCDPNIEAMAWFEQRVPSVTQATTDYRELLANENVDAVYCAVPHSLHATLYPDILDAGKHLFGEKPFGIDLDANAAIQRAIDAHPELVVRCSSEMPFYPGAQAVIDFVRAGHVGEILSVECEFLHSSDINPDKPINWKRMIDINGEYGCMGDLGMHVCHVPLRLGWRPRRVHAELVNRVTTRPNADGEYVPCATWDNATINATVEDGDSRFPLVLKTWRIAPANPTPGRCECTACRGRPASLPNHPASGSSCTTRPVASRPGRPKISAINRCFRRSPGRSSSSASPTPFSRCGPPIWTSCVAVTPEASAV